MTVLRNAVSHFNINARFEIRKAVYNNDDILNFALIKGTIRCGFLSIAAVD